MLRKEEKQSVAWLKKIASQYVNTVESLHHLQTRCRSQLHTERDAGHSNIELPSWQEGNTGANDDMRFADVCRGGREIVRQQLVLLGWEETVQVEVETFELRP